MRMLTDAEDLPLPATSLIDYYQGRKHPRIKGRFSYGPGRLKRAGAVYYCVEVFILMDGSMN